MRRADPQVRAAARRGRGHRPLRHRGAIRARAAADRLAQQIRAGRQGLALRPELTASRRPQNAAVTAVLRRRTEAAGRQVDRLRRVPDRLPVQGQLLVQGRGRVPVRVRKSSSVIPKKARRRGDPLDRALSLSLR